MNIVMLTIKIPNAKILKLVIKAGLKSGERPDAAEFYFRGEAAFIKNTYIKMPSMLIAGRAFLFPIYYFQFIHTS